MILVLKFTHVGILIFALAWLIVGIILSNIFLGMRDMRGWPASILTGLIAWIVPIILVIIWLTLQFK